MAKTEVTARTAAEVGGHLDSKGRKTAREIYLKTAAHLPVWRVPADLGLALSLSFKGAMLRDPFYCFFGRGGRTRRGRAGERHQQRADQKDLRGSQRAASGAPDMAGVAYQSFCETRSQNGAGKRAVPRSGQCGGDGREWISILSHLMGMPIDLNSGEWNDMRSMLIQSEHGLGVSQIGRRVGAAQGAIEPFNYRTPTGRIFAWAAAAGYEAGFLIAVGDITTHPDHIYSYALALGTLLYAQHRSMSAISARHGIDWTARPVPTRIMSIGANATLTAGSPGLPWPTSPTENFCKVPS